MGNTRSASGGPASDKHLELLTRRLIECLVGEALYLEKFAEVKVVRGTEPRPQEKLTAFPALGRHIAHLFAPDGR